MTNKSCRRCGKPSGAYWFCAAHRKANASKARARRQASAARARRLGSSLPALGHNLTSDASFPVASDAWYSDQRTSPAGAVVQFVEMVRAAQSAA